jgi:hypothetical protein
MLSEVIEAISHSKSRICRKVRLHLQDFLKVNQGFLIVSFSEVHLGHPDQRVDECLVVIDRRFDVIIIEFSLVKNIAS